jgi:pyruvate dehydrogenase E2 component (dihydrolipoamide acetyltransferase)
VADEGAVVPVGATIAILGGAAEAAAPPAAQGDGAAAPQAVEGDGQAAPRTSTGGEEVPTRETGEGGEAGSLAAQQTAAAGEASTEARQPAPGGAGPVEALREGYGSDVSTEAEVAGGPAPQSVAETPIGERMEPTTTQANGGHVIASPVAKRLARENNVDIRQITGSGPGSRIVRRDVEAFLKQPRPAAAPTVQPAAPAPQPAAAPAQPAPAPTQPAPAPAAVAAPSAEERPGVRREPLTRMRQTIARRLVQSKGPVPHFYVTTAIDMAAAMELRKQLNASGEVKITVNDLVVKAAALAIRKFPSLNASFAEDAVEYHDYINVSIAVSTETGLLAPAVTDVDKKSLGTVSAEAKELIDRTRNGKATPDELQRGTFSVSNMGMYPWVDSFAAIINPPQAMILAIGAVTEEPVVRDGAIVVGQIMKVTISIDHRTSDGVTGAQYLQELKRLLENPMQILL